VRVLFDGVQLNSTSGPNTFAKHLWRALELKGHVCTTVCNSNPVPDIQLTFIQSAIGKKIAPMVLRLDGAWFNSEQNWLMLNQPIIRSHNMADAVIAQTTFNKYLIRRYIGHHSNVHVIRNGTDLNEIESVEPLADEFIDKFKSVWCCASSWRPHKRLQANISYFLENADEDCCFIVAGENPDLMIGHDRIAYADHLNRITLLKLFKRANKFIHLPWLGHCDNVLIDARASNCEIVCTDSGGTAEIAGKGATIIRDHAWNWKPIRLYDPPKLDFSNHYVGTGINESNIDINDVADMYLDVFREILL